MWATKGNVDPSHQLEDHPKAVALQLREETSLQQKNHKFKNKRAELLLPTRLKGSLFH